MPVRSAVFFRVLVIAALGALCGSASQVRAQADGFGRDKLLHLTVSATLTLGGFSALHALGVDDTLGVPIAVAGALAVGLAKELYDAADYGRFSANDLCWDLLGIATGVLLVAVIKLAFGARPPKPRLGLGLGSRPRTTQLSAARPGLTSSS